MNLSFVNLGKLGKTVPLQKLTGRVCDALSASEVRKNIVCAFVLIQCLHSILEYFKKEGVFCEVLVPKKLGNRAWFPTNVLVYQTKKMSVKERV